MPTKGCYSVKKSELLTSTKAHFIGVKVNVELKSSIPIGEITKISPKGCKGFTLGANAEKGFLSTWEANLQLLRVEGPTKQSNPISIGKF
jgi:hypothetical protein